MHQSQRANATSKQISFLLQDWDDAYNVGSLFRVADSVGAECLMMSGKTPHEGNPMIAVTSLGHHRRVGYRYLQNHTEAAQTMVDEGWHLIAVEIADESAHYREFDYPDKLCLVLGNEERGVYGNVLRLCQASVFIPMFGKGRSMNVVTAGALVAFEARLKTL